MEVGIRVVAENVKKGIHKHTNTSYFTMVAKDDEGNTCMVPELLLETEAEVRRFVEAIYRRKLNRQYQKEVQNMKTHFNLKEAIQMLGEERCEIKLP